MAILSYPIEYSENALRQKLKNQGIENPTDYQVADLWLAFRSELSGWEMIDRIMDECAYRVYDHERIMGRIPNIRV